MSTELLIKALTEAAQNGTEASGAADGTSASAPERAGTGVSIEIEPGDAVAPKPPRKWMTFGTTCAAVVCVACVTLAVATAMHPGGTVALKRRSETQDSV
jgi:hypothetical protein